MFIKDERLSKMNQARWGPKSREILGFGEVQWVKGLPYGREDLSLDSQNRIKLGTVV